MTDQPDRVRGDRTGIDIPAHEPALREGGADWLTRAFQAFGAMSKGNRVTQVVECREFLGGGSGAKAMLKLTYAQPEPELHETLFVKFSRNYADPAGDRARFYMETEVRFAALSHIPGFPINVPHCQFADYHHESGTGVIITHVIPFGEGAVEPQLEKCSDDTMTDVIGHYRALILALADLAGNFKGGKLPAEFAEAFPWDRKTAMSRDRLPCTPEQLQRRVARYAQFAEDVPQLLPEAIRTPQFIASLGEGAELFRANEDAIKQIHHADEGMHSLVHWNANSDNAWYWRDETGTLQCGLFDWGGVGQHHLAMCLWGCLSSADQDLWHDHLDELLSFFVAEYAASGGPQIDVAELRLHLQLYVGTMGLCWLMDAPPRIRGAVPDIADCETRMDPRILANETARVQLQMMSNFLCFWEASDLTNKLKSQFEPAHIRT